VGIVRVLLDTHALLWWLVDDPHLPEVARGVIRNAKNVICVSSASAWEISTKHRLGKLPEAGEIAGSLDRLVSTARLEELPITIRHSLLAGALPGPHRDPFDRMLIAQSRAEAVPVVSGDPIFAEYGVEVVWS
jgi:PIN domain nuclease of toxin-antitoxin system